MLRFRPDGWQIAYGLNNIVYSEEKRGWNRCLLFTLSRYVGTKNLKKSDGMSYSESDSFGRTNDRSTGSGYDTEARLYLAKFEDS